MIKGKLANRLAEVLNALGKKGLDALLNIEGKDKLLVILKEFLNGLGRTQKDGKIDGKLITMNMIKSDIPLALNALLVLANSMGNT